MKIQCDVCEKAEAEVLCCADEAVLCRGCDEKVHAANKLSQKHQRVSLLKQPSSSSSSQLALCDICQERNGYFFCLEDRAILCKHCDMSTHMASPFVSAHQRFFIGGVKVALQSSTNKSYIECSSGNCQSSKFPNISVSGFPTGEESGLAMTLDIQSTSAETIATSGEPHLPTDSLWPFNDILNTDDFSYYEFPDIGPT